MNSIAGEVPEAREEMSRHGLWLRPRVFNEDCPALDAEAAEPETSSEQSSPGSNFTETEILFLKTTAAAKGVLQVHRVLGTERHAFG